jgi:hypothetical protein
MTTISAPRSLLVWSPLLGWALLSCSLSAAQAQVGVGVTTPAGNAGTLPPFVAPGTTTTTTTTTPLPTSTLPGTDSLLGGQGIATDEGLGIDLGSFRLFPTLEMAAGYDSNVFAQGPAIAPTSSATLVVSPKLDLRSEWLNHEIHFLAGGTLGYYSNAPTQNYQNFTLQMDGKVDIYTDFYATGSIAYKRATEALGTPNVSFAQQPTIADSIPVEVSLYQRFNRVFYQATARGTKYSFQDFSTITAGGLPAASRDRWEYEEIFKLGYEIGDDLAIYVAPGLNQRRYDDKTNTAGQQRDSNGQTIDFGATWTPTLTTSLDGFVGYQTQSFLTPGLSSTSAYRYGLKGTWNGYAPLLVRPSVTRSINETALSSFKNYVSTVIAADFEYLVYTGWTLTGGLSYTTADYAVADGVTSANAIPRTDTFITGTLGFLYSVRPQIQIGPSYSYTTSSTTDPVNGSMFNRQLFSIRLIAKR